MIIPKKLDMKYLLTEGNTLFLIINVGYSNINVQKATIKKICDKPLQLQSEGFIILIETENKTQRYILITQEIIDNIKNNSIVNRYSRVYLLTTDPYQLKQKLKEIITITYRNNKLEKAIHNNYDDRQEQLRRMYVKYTTSHMKNTIEKCMNNIKKYCKENKY
jgi:hypothetical protein